MEHNLYDKDTIDYYDDDSDTLIMDLSDICDKSYDSEELPTEWTQANVAPIFKKGSKLQAVNYRPVLHVSYLSTLFVSTFRHP